MQKKMKVMIISILFMGLMTLNSIAIGFSDVSDNQWFYNSVTKMTEEGIFKGYPDGTFKPDNTVTYGEFIKMFIVAVTGEDVGNSSSGNWAKNYYDKGIELGLYTEYDIPEYKLSDGIARKHMSILISNNFKETDIENYNLIKERINDLDLGRPYQHQIIKAYGLGVITGYPGGEFKPNGTLTRAESATVISRLLNEDERIIPKFEKPVADDSYWKNDPQYNEIVEWIANNQKGAVWGGNSSLENGKIYFTHSDGNRWSADNTNFPKLHEYVYFTLKTYYNYAIKNDMGIAIGGDKALNEITIGLRQNKKTPYTMFFFGFEGTPEYLDDVWVNEPNYVRPYVFYYQGRYFTDKDSEILGDELLLAKKLIGNDSLVELNRTVLKKVYGDNTGNKIMDYFLQIHKTSFNEETREFIDLPNPKTTIDGINIYYTDDTENNFYMDKPLI